MKRHRITDPDMVVMDIMNRWPATVAVFLHHKMICVGCTVAPFHTVTEACREHGVDEDRFRADLAAAIAPLPPRPA